MDSSHDRAEFRVVDSFIEFDIENIRENSSSGPGEFHATQNEYLVFEDLKASVRWLTTGKFSREIRRDEARAAVD